jgi:hypothetical protein
MRVLFTAVGIIAFSGTLLAQTKTPAAKPAAKPVARAVAETAAKALGAPAPDVATPGPEEYSYKPDGRRDPFTGMAAASGTDVRGVMQSRSSLVAMIKGPDNKTYLIHQGDKLADGVVKTVTPQGLVVLQDISDPLSAQKQREVRKLLRSLEDAKEKL